MSPTCENGRQTSANNAQIFSSRQKQTLSKRGPQLSTWQHRPSQNAGDFGDKKWSAEAMRAGDFGDSWYSFRQKRSGNCTLRASLTQGTGCFHFLGSPAFCGGFPYAKGASDKALTWGERFLMSPTCTLEQKVASWDRGIALWKSNGHQPDSLGKKERKLHIKSFADSRGTGCFQFLGYPDSLGGLPTSGFSLGRGQERKLHIKSFADTRDWLLSVSGISWFFGGASLKGSSDKALADCKLESKVLMSPTCENGRQTSANNAQIFSPRQKQTLSKRGPQLSTWRQRPLLQNAGDFGDKQWSEEAMRFGNLGDTRFFLGNQERRLHITLEAPRT